MKPHVIQAFDLSLLQVSIYFLMLNMDALTSLWAVNALGQMTPNVPCFSLA